MVKKRGMLIIGVMLLVLSMILVYASVFEDKTSGDFSGTYNFTFYNSSGFIQLNNSISGSSNFSITNGTEMAGNENGLVSYWRFNETSWDGTSGEVKDVLGKNNGTARTGANTSLGLLGRAGSFDGMDNKVQVVNKEELNPLQDSFTITGWAKSYPRAGGAADQWQLYVGKRTTSALDGYYIGLNQGNGLNFMVGDGVNRRDTGVSAYGGSNYIPIAYNNWFHFAAVINRTSKQLLLYVNGTLGATNTFTTLNNINNSANLSIGLDYGQLVNQGGYPVNGSIDEVAIFNKALNSSDILALYNQGKQNVTNTTTGGLTITSGTYESQVKDAGSIVSWGNISWNRGETSAQELPNNQATSGSVNMSGNVLLMHMNEASGTIGDFSSRNNNGTPSGGVNYSSSGKINSALGFDGINDYISIPNSADFNLGNTLTIEAWIYPTNLGGRPAIFSTRVSNPANSFQLEVGVGNFHSDVVAVAGVSTWVLETQNNAVTPNQWNYIVYTRNGSGTGNHKIYVNGQLKTLQTESAYNFIDNSNAKLVGAGTSLLPEHYFSGKIDELAVYNRVLSQEEITARYNRMNGSASGIQFQIRTSNDNSTWSSWQGTGGEGSYYTSPSGINASNSRYIKYKAYFDDISKRLYNASINYNAISELSVSLDAPADNYLTNEYNNINITCSASSINQLMNITPYFSKFGWDESEPARSVSGTSNATTFTLNEISSTVIWNCYVCDDGGNCAFSSSNRTIIGDILAPEINLISPENNYMENSSQNLNFIFNATDNRVSSLNCKLLVDSVEVASNSSVIPGIQTAFSYTLGNGNYTWKINCSDGLNSKLSGERNLTVSVSSAYVPFWAKVNTHTHTTNSDGDSSPATVVGLYQSKGYNILAITDHGYVTNCTPFTNSSFICINSEEWTSTKHVVRINVSAAYNNNIVNMQNAVNAANAGGGFSIAAHPNWSSTTWSVSDLTSLQNYTAMEIYNKVIERLSPDPYAVSKWDDVLKTGKKMFGVAADDMHQVNVDLGYGFTKVYMPEFTKQAYINSMMSGYFYASQGPNMDLEPFNLVCDELDSYHMGETANCSSVRITTIVSATNSTYTTRNITLVKDGVSLNITSCSSQNCSFSYSENVSSSGYYRLEATDSWNKKIWSNPIWVNKIALPVIIIVNSPGNNSYSNDYTPLLNISLNQATSLWYRLNNGNNVSLCSDCSGYAGYLSLIEGDNIIRVYANNSDNIIKENMVSVSLDFNKSMSDSFDDNSSLASMNNVFWNSGKISMNSSNMFGNFILKNIITINNITSFYVEWIDNNTAGAKGEGQRIPIILKYQLGNSGWINTNNDGNYIVNGSSVSGLNGNNLSLMLDFEKNPTVPIDLLSFKITWTEFTVPLILIPINKTTTSSSAVISWTTDTESNSSIEYGGSPILGNVISDSNFVMQHSLTIQNLNQNTIYYFKIKSCTNDSCAEYPQSPYPVDSFTTQSVSQPPVTPPSDGGGGGGGGGGATLKPENKTELSFSITNLNEVVMRAGESRTLSLEARNTGRLMQNNCKILGSGWITGPDKKDVNANERTNFVFTVKVPKDAEIKDYQIPVTLKCQDGQKIINFRISIVGGDFDVFINEISSISREKISFTYTLRELSGYDKNVGVDFTILDSEGNKIVEEFEIIGLSAGEIKELSKELSIPLGVSGEHVLYVGASSEGIFIEDQKEILISKVTGLASFFSSEENKKITSIIVIILIAGLLGFFVVKRILRTHKQFNDHKGVIKISGK